MFAFGTMLLMALTGFGAPEGDDSLSAFSLTPASEYSIEDDSWRSRHGTRLDYHRDEWSLWWSAEGVVENSADRSSSESRFGWGGEWRRDGVYADASARLSDDRADFRAGAGARWDVDGWKLRPLWSFHADSLKSGSWGSRTDAELAMEWARMGWDIRPSFGAGASSGTPRASGENGAFIRLRLERTLGQ